MDRLAYDVHHGSGRWRRRLAAVLIVGVLLAAGCGRDVDSGTGAQSSPNPDSESTTSDAGDATDAGAETASAAAADTTTPPAAGLETGAFGTLGTVCREGDAEPVERATGIDGTTITVGTFSDVGFAGIPGLNQEFFDTATAVAEWCNEQGGVGGYTIDPNLHDAALTEYAREMIAACDADFFLVGGGGVLDDTGQESRLGCALPDLSAFSVTTSATDADLGLTSLPNPVDELAVAEQIYAQQRWPEAVTRVGIVTLATPTTLLIRDRYLEAFEHLGWTAVYSAELAPLGETNYAPFVLAMKQQDVELVVAIIETAVFAALQQAAADHEFAPTAWLPTTNTYDPKYLELGRENAVDTFTRTIFWPLERADENQATTDYLELLGTVDGKVSLLGMQSMSTWMLFLTSLGTCVEAGTITRDCVYEEASRAAEWTAGGLHAPIDVTGGSAPECVTILEATPDGWVLAPDQELNDAGYRCDPAYVEELTGEYGEGARCPSEVEDPLPSECA